LLSVGRRNWKPQEGRGAAANAVELFDGIGITLSYANSADDANAL
jgi:hypothetical protein